jgi:hypothetical protein
MQQIIFTVSPEGDLRAILSALQSMKDVTDIHVSTLSDASDNEIVVSKKKS